MHPSAHAMSTAPDPGPERRRAPFFVRYFDGFLILAALLIFLAFDFPIGGWVAASGIWVVQRVVSVFAEQRAAQSTDPKVVASLMVGSTIARAFAVVFTIFAVGVGDHERGLAAALLFVALYTLFLPATLLLRSAAYR
jgi:hypothetical protein